MLFFKKEFNDNEDNVALYLNLNAKKECPFKDLINFDGVVVSVDTPNNGFQNLRLQVDCNGKKLEVNCFSNKKLLKVGDRAVIVGRDFFHFKYFVE